MEWRPAGLSVCLPLLIFPCTIKSRSSVLASAHPDGPGKRAVKLLWCGVVVGQHEGHLPVKTAVAVSRCSAPEDLPDGH